MLAQLLGMGRVKKDKGKEREKGLARDEGEAGGDGQGEDLVPLSNGSFSSATAPREAAQHHHTPTAAAQALHANGGHQHNGDEAAAAADQAEANCERCGRTHPEEGGAGDGDGGLGDEDSDGDDEDRAHSGGAARALAPGPPPGPPGFSSPAARTAVVKQPLGQKAFSVEVAGVERGLYIQLGEAGAKTEAQLGEQQLEAAKRLRHLLITNRERMVQELLSRGWVPLLLRWLGLVHRPNLQVEALSALTTVAQSTTEHTPLLLKHGAVLTLVSLLKSPSLEMVEQAMWVLGKMAQDGQDGTTARDAVLQAGVLGPLVRCLEQHPSLLSLQRIGAWSLFNLFDGQPRPTVDVATVGMVMPAINRLLRGGDSEVLSHACSTLSHLCDGSAAHIKVVVESGVCNRLVQLLDHPSSQVVKPALRTIGNVVCAEDDADYTEAILEAGSIVCLKKLIAHPNREIQKEACWTLSNIAAGSVSQIQSVLDSGAMPQLIKLATSADTESEVRSEAFWVVLNAASCGSDAQIEYLVSQGCVQILSDLLGESSMVMMALEGIERVLSVGDLRVVRSAIASHSHADQGAEDIGDHGGGHCMECASVAAVGAAAAAAAATAAGDGQEGGDLGGEAGAYTNPYACMLTPEKIQALEAHKNSAVAKRANRVWARYFVTCAICRRSFSRHVSSATFCAECNCHVCGSCDCTVFHLAYQDKLWEEMEGKEKKGKQAQQAAKKSKKAKKREKKKNAAKEPAMEPAKEVKVVGVSGQGVDGGKDSPVSTRAGGAGKDKEGRVTVQRSQGLGKKSQGHHRSPSPHKTSSSASTESNSEDEYSPSPPQNAYTTIATPAAPTSSAAAIINATAIAVTAAAKNASRAPRTPRAKAPQPTTSPPPPPREVASPKATSSAGTVATAVSREPHAEEQQRRVGKKQGRRDQQQQQQPAATAATATVAADRSSSSSSSRSPTHAPARASARARAGSAGATANTLPDISVPKTENGLAAEDDDEEPWVVVGSRGGQQAAGSTAAKRSGNGAVLGSTAGPKHTKWSKGQQRPGDAASGWVAPPAPPPGSGGGASVVEWASESSPSATVRAVKTRSNVSTPPPAAVAPRASPPPPALGTPPVHVVSSNGGRVGGGSAWASVPKPAPQAMSVMSMSPAAASATGLSAKSLRSTTNGTGSPHVIPQRPGSGPGPGPGSVWGASAPVVDARPVPLLGTVINSSLDATAGPSARAPAPRNRAGVIGPPAQAAVGGKSPSLSAAPKPVESPPLLLPTAKALSPLTASVNKLSASSLTGARGNGEAALAVGSRVSVPAKQRLGRKGSGGSVARSSSGGGDGEALVENEKLVSFLIETGSILALAQRLEEEEEWRRAAPSPASSGPS